MSSLFHKLSKMGQKSIDYLNFCCIIVCMECIKTKIKNLAIKYSVELKNKISDREVEMRNDDKSHYLIYQVLGISCTEGDLIDLYQNKGRFLYKYAGSFLEEATILCFKEKFSNCKPKIKINNHITAKPKQFEIDFLLDKNAYEIKWRDATTDGDHITKEHTRVKAIKANGFKPIRIMFYYPNRTQAIKIQEILKDLYVGIGGEYYSGEDAWAYIHNATGINLKNILVTIAKEQEAQ